MEEIPRHGSEAPSLPRMASFTTIPLPPGDPGVGNNRLITGFTPESWLRKAQDRLAYALEQTEQLRGLQTTAQENLDDRERSLRYTKKVVAEVQELGRQKELVVARIREEIRNRAKQIKESEDLTLATQSEIEEIEAHIKKMASWKKSSNVAIEQQVEVVNMDRARTEALIDEMNRLDDNEFDEFQALVQEAHLARNGGTPTPKRKATEMGTPENKKLEEEIQEAQETQRERIAANPVTPLAKEAPREPSNLKNHDDVTAPTSHTTAKLANTSSHPVHASKKPKKSQLSEKYRNLPHLTSLMRTRFKNEGRCFACHELGHRRFDSVCPLFGSSAYGPAPRAKPVSN